MGIAPLIFGSFLLGALVGYYAGAYALCAHLSRWSETFGFFQ